MIYNAYVVLCDGDEHSPPHVVSAYANLAEAEAGLKLFDGIVRNWNSKRRHVIVHAALEVPDDLFDVPEAVAVIRRLDQDNG